jgi:hypothetical protein
MIAWLLLAACRGDGEDTGAAPDVTVETRTATSDAEGYVTIPVEMEEGGIFQVIVARARGYLSTDYVGDPAGNTVYDWEDWYEADRSLTDACFPERFATTINWPVRPQDGPLEAGTWQVRAATVGSDYSYVGNADVDVTILRRTDDDPEHGVLHVTVAYAEGVEQDAEAVRGTEAAVAYWTRLYAGWGITLDVEWSTFATDAALPATSNGLQPMVAYLEGKDRPRLLLLVGESIAGSASSTYGMAGGIPGSWIATPTSAVFVSWLANAGRDAEFTEAEISLFGETMAHETGHFLGLFHPVEDGYAFWDSLDDTVECDSWDGCDEALGANLMYPYPVCTAYSASTCGRQDQLTGTQSGVMHRWIGVEAR